MNILSTFSEEEENVLFSWRKINNVPNAQRFSVFPCFASAAFVGFWLFSRASARHPDRTTRRALFRALYRPLASLALAHLPSATLKSASCT